MVIKFYRVWARESKAISSVNEPKQAMGIVDESDRNSTRCERYEVDHNVEEKGGSIAGYNRNKA